MNKGSDPTSQTGGRATRYQKGSVCVCVCVFTLLVSYPAFPGFAGDGQNYAGVLVREWSRTPDSTSHQKDPVAAQYSGGH